MKSLRKTLISLSLVGAMLASFPLSTVKAAADSEGKYVSEVYVAYGKSKEEASQWLKDNGWEPVDGDLGAGKNSSYDEAVSAVMGIHRTGNASDAITDMAVMNMNGSYSFDKYSEAVEDKKKEINAFLDSMIPVLQEYRENLSGEASEAGRMRAEMAQTLLNKFYDGGEDEKYAKNDTGKPLGDLFTSTTKYELGDDAYEALSDADKKKYGDLQQILLESTSTAAQAVEMSLAFAADTNEDTWLERLSSMQGEDLVNEIEFYVEDATPGMSQSAAESLLDANFQDLAVTLSEQWGNVHSELVWVNEYKAANGLEIAEGEEAESYSKRIDEFFDSLPADEAYPALTRFRNASILSDKLSDTEFSGDWGATLYDFFLPADGTDYTGNYKEFTRFAAALSKGQRASAKFMSLQVLILLAANDEEAAKSLIPEYNEMAEEQETVSVYAGMRREIFRDGVALTDEAVFNANNGKSPYDEAKYDDGKFDFVFTIASAAIDAVLLTSAIVMKFSSLNTMFKYSHLAAVQDVLEDELEKFVSENSYYINLNKIANYTALALGVLVLAETVTMIVYTNYQNYHRTFTKIPLLMVDSDDIITYKTDADGKQILDEDGKPVRDISFNQFLYYDAVKCNRQIIGVNAEAQEGVASYAEWGCGDVADLNCDYGKEWIALYTNKSNAKGNPILADSLTVQYGSKNMPENCTRSLHKFRNTFAFNTASESYSYNDDMHGIYLFWADDPNAYGTASAAGSVFGTGLAALFGVGGLGLGILGTMLVMMPRRKKQEA